MLCYDLEQRLWTNELNTAERLNDSAWNGGDTRDSADDDDDDEMLRLEAEAGWRPCLLDDGYVHASADARRQIATDALDAMLQARGKC